MHEQTIYFGAPGTGKSYCVNEALKKKKVDADRIFRVTIHPEFTYSDFIGQLLPEVNSASKSVYFVFKPGPFTRALIKAFEDSSQDVYLILEEMSRGNVAAIFGDIFQLLDRDQHFNSKYPIRNKNVSDLIKEVSTDEIILPSNFNILGTVNLNDQNVFPMDTAFKRRFSWEYVTSLPAFDVSGNRLQKLNNAKISISINENPSDNIITNWQSFYTALNMYITDKDNGMGRTEDKQIGQFFIEFDEQVINDSHSADAVKISTSLKKINDIIRNKLLLFLWQDVQGHSSLNNSKKIFDKDIKSFDDLYFKYGVQKFFSEDFIESFLKPNIDKYPW